MAVFFISTSAPLIAATTAPAVAIAFWRTALGALFTAPYTLLRHRRELLGLDRRQLTLCVVGGVLLAAHFATWIPSLRYTSVASSTALVSTQPVWAALMARAMGVKFPTRVWVGISVALVGVVVLTGVDVSLDRRSLIGDGLALVGAVLAAAYVTVGERARRDVSTASYTLVAYSSSAFRVAACVPCGGCGAVGLLGDGLVADSGVDPVGATVGALAHQCHPAHNLGDGDVHGDSVRDADRDFAGCVFPWAVAAAGCVAGAGAVADRGRCGGPSRRGIHRLCGVDRIAHLSLLSSVGRVTLGWPRDAGLTARRSG